MKNWGEDLGNPAYGRSSRRHRLWGHDRSDGLSVKTDQGWETST